jgi:hypothetical protein
MAEKTYSLYSDAEMLDQKLAVEIGDSYMVLVAGADGKISGIEYFTTGEGLAETMDEIGQLSSLLKKNYSETKIFYHVRESVLVPTAQFNTAVAAEFIDLSFGNDASSRVNVENINVAPGIVNVYRSHESWQDVISRSFRAVTKRHLYSKLVEDVVTDDELRLIFYKDSFIIIAVKDGQLKITRNFDFANDADALYHILNVCRQVDIKLDETLVSICGLINLDSTLFTLLEQYCDTILINDSPKLTLPAGQEERYPSHYFTSFVNLLS